MPLGIYESALLAEGIGWTHQTECPEILASSALQLLVSGCASQAPSPDAYLPTVDARTALACALPSNCMNSFDSAGLEPLRFEGTPAQAIAALQTTLADFAEAKIVSTHDRSLPAVFTTAVGFRDLIDFRLDAAAQRIDYRSRSSFGLFDFGKNRARMSTLPDRFKAFKTAGQ